MPFLFKCSCGATLKLKDHLRGKTLRCPACKESVTVPQDESRRKNNRSSSNSPMLQKTATAISSKKSDNGLTQKRKPGVSANDSIEQTKGVFFRHPVKWLLGCIAVATVAVIAIYPSREEPVKEHVTRSDLLMISSAVIHDVEQRSEVPDDERIHEILTEMSTGVLAGTTTMDRLQRYKVLRDSIPRTRDLLKFPNEQFIVCCEESAEKNGGYVATMNRRVFKMSAGALQKAIRDNREWLKTFMSNGSTLDLRVDLSDVCVVEFPSEFSFDQSEFPTHYGTLNAAVYSTSYPQQDQYQAAYIQLPTEAAGLQPLPAKELLKQISLEFAGNPKCQIIREELTTINGGRQFEIELHNLSATPPLSTLIRAIQHRKHVHLFAVNVRKSMTDPTGFMVRKTREKFLNTIAFDQRVAAVPPVNVPRSPSLPNNSRLPPNPGPKERLHKADKNESDAPASKAKNSESEPSDDSMLADEANTKTVDGTKKEPPTKLSEPIGEKPNSDMDNITQQLMSRVRPMHEDIRFDLNSVPVPEFPELPPPYETLDSGETIHFVKLQGNSQQPGSAMTMRIYMPPIADGISQKRGCVLIAPAGTNLIRGNDVGKDDYHAETMPYVKAGMVVILYSLDGAYKTSEPTEQERIVAYDAFRKSCAGLVNGRNALEFAIQRMPQIDPSRIYTVGHSSAGTHSLLFAEHEPRLAGCIAYAPATDVEGRLSKNGMIEELEDVCKGLAEFARRSSPVTHLRHLSRPTFIHHPRADQNVPIQLSMAFVVSAQIICGLDNLDSSHGPGGHYQGMIEHGIPSGIIWIRNQEGLPLRKSDIEFQRRQNPFARLEERISGSLKTFERVTDLAARNSQITRADSGRIVVFQIKSYNGTQDATLVARKIFKDVEWMDGDKAEVDFENKRIVAPMKSGTFNTGPVKAALEKAGFTIGLTGVGGANMLR